MTDKFDANNISKSNSLQPIYENLDFTTIAGNGIPYSTEMFEPYVGESFPIRLDEREVGSCTIRKNPIGLYGECVITADYLLSERVNYDPYLQARVATLPKTENKLNLSNFIELLVVPNFNPPKNKQKKTYLGFKLTNVRFRSGKRSPARDCIAEGIGKNAFTDKLLNMITEFYPECTQVILNFSNNHLLEFNIINEGEVENCEILSFPHFIDEIRKIESGVIPSSLVKINGPYLYSNEVAIFIENVQKLYVNEPDLFRYITINLPKYYAFTFTSDQIDTEKDKMFKNFIIFTRKGTIQIPIYAE